EIRARMLNRAALTASFTGTGGVGDAVARTLESWGNAMRAEPMQAHDITLPATDTPTREGLAAPMQVAFCSRVSPAPHQSDPAAPLLQAASRIISMEYVLDEVRFKGTAYGGGCGYSGSTRSWNFYSYRDPWVQRTLDVYDGTLDWIKRFDWSREVVERAIISTAKNFERPIRPGEATSQALIRHISGETRALREA